MTSPGFTETAFMSSTRELSVALEYSGVKQGRVGTVSIQLRLYRRLLVC